VPLASGLLTGKMTKATTFAANDHRSFNRHGESFDVGETFAGVPYGVGLAAVAELKALVPEGERFKVFVVDSAGIAHAREVTVGGRSETAAEITSGLAGGETVVTYGAYGVSDSARIVPAKP
jgi:hypothetical protein